MPEINLAQEEEDLNSLILECYLVRDESSATIFLGKFLDDDRQFTDLSLLEYAVKLLCDRGLKITVDYTDYFLKRGGVQEFEKEFYGRFLDTLIREFTND